MYEYIYGVTFSKNDDGIYIANIGTNGEEVVRCRDCKHWQPWMKGAEPECWANGEPFSTPPDGFCAWGERK